MIQFYSGFNLDKFHCTTLTRKLEYAEKINDLPQVKYQKKLYTSSMCSKIFLLIVEQNCSSGVMVCTPHRHVILIPSQPIFALTPQCCLLSREATNSNFIMFIVFGVTWPGLKPIIYLHFQQYFSYIMAVSFISGENWSMRRKSTTCLKSNIRRSYIPVVCVVRYSYW
jgi:hypothetical protein